MKFKEGDMVVCITPYDDHWKVGDRYTIQNYKPRYALNKPKLTIIQNDDKYWSISYHTGSSKLFERYFEICKVVTSFNNEIGDILK